MGLRPKPCSDPSWKKGLRTPRTFTEKGIPPTTGTQNLSGASVGGMPFSVKFLRFLDPSSKTGLGRVWNRVPRSSFRFFCEKGLTNGGKCAMIKVRGNASDGCSLRVVKNNRSEVASYGRLFLFIDECQDSDNRCNQRKHKRGELQQIREGYVSHTITSLRRKSEEERNLIPR